MKYWYTYRGLEIIRKHRLGVILCGIYGLQQKVAWSCNLLSMTPWGFSLPRWLSYSLYILNAISYAPHILLMSAEVNESQFAKFSFTFIWHWSHNNTFKRKLFCCIPVFSSPEPKARVSYCHSAQSVVRPSVVVRRPSVNFSHFRLLLQNR